MRKFEVIKTEMDPGGAGPDRLWKVYYRAIVKKIWKEAWVWSIARNAKQAEERAIERFRDKE